MSYLIFICCTLYLFSACGLWFWIVDKFSEAFLPKNSIIMPGLIQAFGFFSIFASIPYILTFIFG